jgi:hypothetical protein
MRAIGYVLCTISLTSLLHVSVNAVDDVSVVDSKAEGDGKKFAEGAQVQYRILVQSLRNQLRTTTVYIALANSVVKKRLREFH